MKTGMRVGIVLSILLSGIGFANNSVASEASHVAGGVILGGIATAVTDKYFHEYTEHRWAIGFWSVAAIATVEFGVEMAQDHSDTSGELMDMGFTILGGAIGSYVTDRFFLAPYIHKAPNGSANRGIEATYKF